MTASAGPALRRLNDEFGGRVAFLTLYVREAHPGDHYPQAESLERKLDHARDYQQQDAIGWPVAVDDIDGSLHRRLDPKPHAAYLMAADGTVAFRTLWANDERLLREALAAVAEGRLPRRRQRQPRMLPMLRGTGCMWQSWTAAGGHAKTDVLRQAPPVYLSGRLAALFSPLPPLARGIVGARSVVGTARGRK